ETIEEKIYIKIKEQLQMKDHLILKETFVEKLNKIFETDYKKIEAKIFNETITIGDSQTEEERFAFFVRHALLNFIANFKYRLPKVLDRNMSERTFIVECISPIFRAFRNAFPDIKYKWIEKNVTSIKEANNIFQDDICSRKTDLLVVYLSDGVEIISTEVSVGDVKKLLMMSVCSLCRIFGNNLDCSIDDTKGIRTYSIQIIGD
ncbi:3856_t:CDS:2, partial [Racocetra fulgida]